MEISRRKRILQNVAPAILANACVFLFSVVDGVFVGNGAGSQALGAVNLALPFVLLAQALNAMASIGGVTFTAIRFGRGDKAGAQSAFMHSLTLNLLAGILITLAGSVCTGAVCSLLGASESYLPLVREYVCWYALFAIPNALSLNLQSFCRNDGSLGLVAVTNVVSTALNIFLDWLFVFPPADGRDGGGRRNRSFPDRGRADRADAFPVRKGQPLHPQIFTPDEAVPEDPLSRASRSDRAVFAARHDALQEPHPDGVLRRYRHQCVCDHLLPVLLYHGGVFRSVGGDAAAVRTGMTETRGLPRKRCCSAAFSMCSETVFLSSFWIWASWEPVWRPFWAPCSPCF